MSTQTMDPKPDVRVRAIPVRDQTRAPVSWPVIAVKELRELMVTGRFQAAAALVFLLIAVTLGIMARSHARALEDYGIAESTRVESLREHGHLNRITAWEAQDPPNPLSVLVSGIAANGRLGFFDNDALAVAYPPADLIMIVGIVLSLVALLFAHDGFTGERERGTLRLLVSGAASRGSILTGKLVGRYAALLVPLLGGLLAGALALVLSPDIGWGATETVAFVALVGISMLFLAVFVALGLLVSAWSRTTHGSLGLALSAWGVLILIVPSLAPYAAAAVAPTDNPALHRLELRTIMNEERDALALQLQREWTAPVLSRHPEIRDYYQLPDDRRAAALAADPGLAASVERYQAVSDSATMEANDRMRAKEARVREAFDSRLQAQVRLTERVASLSPYSALVLASLELTETGPRAKRRRDDQYNTWHDATLRPWMQTKMEELRQEDPTIGWNTRAEITGVPWFHYESEPVGDRVAATLPEVGALTGFGVLFLLLGFVGFRRYDVR
ncbi:MAG: ABC transporter permease subunit [Gemmatimonadota bacterium]